MFNNDLKKNPADVSLDVRIYEFFKRCFDLFISIIGMVVSFPIIVVVGILVRIETQGPIIYSQERVGKNNVPFLIYKIRSMYSDAEIDGAKWADINDSRVTKVGSFIRKTRIDELPQFYNIFKGEMSLIGPRPEREMFIRTFEKDIPNFRDRLSVKPGLTGWAQVNGGYDHEPQDKLKYDLYYIDNRCFKLDLLIVFKTIAVIIKGDGAR